MSAGFDRDAALASPLYSALHPVLGRLPAARFPSIEDLNACIDGEPLSGGGARIRFVAPFAQSKAFEDRYEVRVYRDGTIPTRAGDLHDLFNALVWLSFPRTKAGINRLHHQQMLARRGDRLRGPVRDALTLFDESGVIVACADPSLSSLLKAFQWKALFWDRREEVRRSMRFFVFGHAIHEKALEPYLELTAKALVIEVDSGLAAAAPQAQLALLDERAEHWLSQSAQPRSTRDLLPLPLMGVPGWRAQNAVFYDNAAVFRPARRTG